jgi:hypothetical protein
MVASENKLNWILVVEQEKRGIAGDKRRKKKK